jgi:multiple sugar transport system ATP-binding protein
MDVERNMTYALQLRRRPRSEIASALADAAGTLGLGTLLRRYPRELSGGQRQRVAMGRAIVRHPRVFLFDEPLSNLDAELRVKMRAEVRRLHERLGATSVYVTHDQIEAMTMADHVVVLRAGSVEQQGPPLQLYDRPANRFVAGFIGSPAMNFVDGRTSEDGGSVVPAGLARGLPLGRILPAGRPVQIGLRPEHLRPRPGAPVDVTVTAIESTGSQAYVLAEQAGQPLVFLEYGRSALKRGDAVSLEIDPGHIHVFDPETGRAL